MGEDLTLMGADLTLLEHAETGRADIKPIELFVRRMQTLLKQQPSLWEGQEKELSTHIDLAVRHLEDARMRLGKVIQYLGTDVASVYDR